MTDIGVGYDYHLAEVSRVVNVANNFVGYVAHCDACGWVGENRLARNPAEDDAAAHDLANNPPSNR
jgi:hypothetical protein